MLSTGWSSWLCASGPSGDIIAQLALDTGATTTLINTPILLSIGYEPDLSPDRTQITTGSTVEAVPRVRVERLVALGKTVRELAVVCHNLPPTAAVDGLLGLDFLRKRRLMLDFRRSTISLT